MDKKEEITLIVTASAAAEKAPDLIGILKGKGYKLKVLLTNAAVRYKLIDPEAVKTASRIPSMLVIPAVRIKLRNVPLAISS